MSARDPQGPPAPGAHPGPSRAGAAGRETYTRFLALRFVRARRQGVLSLISLLVALGFMVGVASLIVVLSMMTGFQDAVIGRIYGANAHILVLPDGDKTVIRDEDAVAARLAAVPGVAVVEPVLHGMGGIVAASGLAQWTSVTGLDPTLERHATRIDDAMITGSLATLGRPTTSGRSGIILGKELAQRLGVTVGDTVQLLVPRPKLAPWGPMVQQQPLEVVGVFSVGYSEYDAMWSFVALSTARKAFGVAQGAHWMAARVQDVARLDEVEAAVTRALGDEFLVRDIIKSNGSFFAALRLEKLMISLCVGLIVLVAALGVVSTLVLTVTQKVREIGVLSAMGATPGGLLRVFMYQGLMMGVSGAALGAVLGVTIAVVLDRYRLVRLDPDVYYLDHLPFVVHLRDLGLVVGASLLVALVATLYPAWGAARLDPVEALRHE